MSHLSLLLECARSIREAVLPLIGTEKAKKTFGRGAGGDLTKEIDLTAERIIIETLKDASFSCTLISEESGLVKLGTKPQNFYVITDPLDGTTNATRAIPFVATSIAISREPRLSGIEAAVVGDLIHDVFYAAEKGKGAYKNNERIRASANTDIVNSVLGVDVNTYKSPNPNVHAKLSRILTTTKHPRYFGANALELCYVADGTIDAFIDIRRKLRLIDMAAAYLIMKEAGAIVTTLDGEPLDASITPQTRITIIAAGTKTLHEKIMRLLHG